MNDLIVKEQVFHHPIDTVWNAISRGEEISSWFLKADFKAKVGYAYTFNSKEDDCSPIRGVVQQANPYTLVYTWIVENTGVETTVKWVLEKIDGGTRLYLEHSGISKYPENSAIAMFESFNGGWENCISELSKYLTQELHAE